MWLVRSTNLSGRKMGEMVKKFKDRGWVGGVRTNATCSNALKVLRHVVEVGDNLRMGGPLASWASGQLLKAGPGNKITTKPAQGRQRTERTDNRKKKRESRRRGTGQLKFQVIKPMEKAC